MNDQNSAEKPVMRVDGSHPDCPYEKLPAPWTPSSGGKGYRATRITSWSPPVDGHFALTSHEEDYTASGDFRRFKSKASCQKRCDKLNKMVGDAGTIAKDTKDTFRIAA